MAKKDINFSNAVQKGADPMSANGEMLTRAAHITAAGSVEAAQVQGNQMKAVAGLGVDAVKGSAESNLESETKKVIDSYEARVKTEDAKLTLNLFDSGLVEGNPKEVEQAKADITKYKDALDQGIMTREQALLAIDKSVKEFSRTMPGFATDFRKLATTLTGVEHMGSFREYSLLAKQSANDKLRADQLKFLQDIEQKQLTMYVEKYGRMPVGGLKGEDMAIFRSQLKLSAEAENLKKQIEMRDATISQNEPKVTNYVNFRMADGIMTLSTLMQGLVTGVDPKTGKPFSAENKILLRQNLLANTNTFFEKVKTELMGFNTNQVSNGTREQLLTRLNTQHKELVDSLKNQDTFDDFRKTMELRASQASDVMNQWAIANPHLKIIKESGMATPDVAKLWIDSQREPRRQTEFRKIYGGALDDYFKSITTGGKPMGDYHSSNMIGASTSEEHMASLRMTNPAAHQAAVLSLRDHIKAIATTGWGDTTEMQEMRKGKFADNLRVFASQINPADNNAVTEWTKLMADPKVAARIKELPNAAVASAPVMNKTRELIENPEFGVMARINRMKEQLAVTQKNKGFDLYLDPATQQIKVLYYPWQGASQNTEPTGMAQTKEGAVTGKGGVGGKRPQQTGVEGNGSQVGDNGPELKRLVDTANRALAVMNNFSDALPEDLKGNLAKDTVNKFGEGYFGLDPAGRVDFLEKKGGKNDTNTREGFNKEAAKLTDSEDAKTDRAAEIRLKEVGGNITAVDQQIQMLENGLKTKGMSTEARQILTKELQLWTKAKQLGSATALPAGEGE